LAPRSAAPPRRWRRRTASLDVAWGSGAESRRARATTLGAGGLFVRTEAAPAEGSPLRVRFRLPGSQVLHELGARVAWVLAPGQAGPHAPGMGLAFSDPAEIAALARELERLDAEGSEAGGSG
jgi:Tfp pilus assembly protein PilZ